MLRIKPRTLWVLGKCSTDKATTPAPGITGPRMFNKPLRPINAASGGFCPHRLLSRPPYDVRWEDTWNDTLALSSRAAAICRTNSLHRLEGRSARHKCLRLSKSPLAKNSSPHPSQHPCKLHRDATHFTYNEPCYEGIWASFNSYFRCIPHCQNMRKPIFSP